MSNHRYTPEKWFYQITRWGENFDHKIITRDLGVIAVLNKTPWANRDIRTIGKLISATPDLLYIARRVLEWAETPQDHGGNPYSKEFVMAAKELLEERNL